VDKSFLTWHASHARHAEGEPRPRRRARADARAEQARSRTWNEFQEKVAFLQAIGYLADDLSEAPPVEASRPAPNRFNPGARILRHVQISEVFVSELVLSGLLEDLSPQRLFGVLCGLTNELPRHVQAHFRLRPEDRTLAKRIEQTRYSDVVMGAEE